MMRMQWGALAMLIVAGSATFGQEIKQPVPGNFEVQPYYVYPADQKHHPEYEKAIKRVVKEVRTWFKKKAGVTFRLKPLKTVQAQEDYLTMRCGMNPKERDKGGQDKFHMPQWVPALEKAVGGWRPREIAWVFAQGGGGRAGGNLQRDHAGFAVFGDWVLEPISGLENPAGIPARIATWQVEGGTPIGTTAHELGHAFGLHHPDGYKGDSIMRRHGDYPDTGFLPHEILILKHSPFCRRSAYHPKAPHLDFGTPDHGRQGKVLEIFGKGFASGDQVEFVDSNGSQIVAPDEVKAERIKVKVPEKQGPGFIRILRGRQKSNIVPINIYPAG